MDSTPITTLRMERRYAASSSFPATLSQVVLGFPVLLIKEKKSRELEEEGIRLQEKINRAGKL